MSDTRFKQEGGAAESEAAAREIATLAAQPAAIDTAVLRSVPDLRGIRCEDASGIPVGHLWGALAEAETGLLRYVDLELETLDRHVLVPIGHARVHGEGREGPCIRLRAALLEQLEQVPPFAAEVGHIDDPYERALLEAYGRTFHGERYYAHPAYDHSGIYVGEHPVVSGDGSGDEPLNRLSYLTGWKVASGEPDIRGWPLVLAGDGTRVEVMDLIVDTAAERVRYVVVPLPDGDGARLIPVGFLRVDTDAKKVVAEGFTATDLAELPPYLGGGVTRIAEDSLNAALRRTFSGRRRYLLPDFRA
ncbi:MAG TPA: PRC-barrel domain-containing protein [Longimicrobiales bacterium]|nr:PRC-barrel domain-containing protein [Longimicrobiales bacterium]